MIPNDARAKLARRASTVPILLGLLATLLVAGGSVFLVYCVLWFFNLWFPIW
jgi:hypothetical protein